MPGGRLPPHAACRPIGASAASPLGRLIGHAVQRMKASEVRQVMLMDFRKRTWRRELRVVFPGGARLAVSDIRKDTRVRMQIDAGPWKAALLASVMVSLSGGTPLVAAGAGTGIGVAPATITTSATGASTSNATATPTVL